MQQGSRREFFTRYFARELARVAGGFQEGLKEAREEAEFERFFESYENSYSLTLAYPEEILLESARRAGIPVEGRERREVVRDLWRQQRGR
jgi:hypothetical protein